MGCNPSVMVAPPRPESLVAEHTEPALSASVQAETRRDVTDDAVQIHSGEESKQEYREESDAGQEDSPGAPSAPHDTPVVISDPARDDDPPELVRERTAKPPAPRSAPKLDTQQTSAMRQPIEGGPLQGASPKTSASPSKRRMRWKKGELIGAGSYGKVFVGLNELSGSLMAVKEVRASSETEVRALQQEVGLMRSLRHENIVQYLGSEADARLNIVYIFTEWVPGGSIAGLLQKFGGLTESVVRKYTRQILQGLAYLHRKGVIHRDIKGANILVDDRGCIKLADFGASKVLSGSANGSILENHSLRGTPYFMAPEVIMQSGHGRKADIWSVGCTTLQMVSGKPPWKSMQFGSLQALMYHICNTNEAPPMPHDISTALRSFLMICFQRLPAERPTANSLLQHPFLTHTVHDEVASVGSLTEREVEERPLSTRSFAKSRSTFFCLDGRPQQDNHGSPLDHQQQFQLGGDFESYRQSSTHYYGSSSPGDRHFVDESSARPYNHREDDDAAEEEETKDAQVREGASRGHYVHARDGSDRASPQSQGQDHLAATFRPEHPETSFLASARRVDELEVSSYVRDRVLQSQRKRDEWENTVIETVEVQKIRDSLRRREEDLLRKKQAEQERWQREMKEELDYQRRSGLRS